MDSEALKAIRKKSKIHTVNGYIVDSLESNSSRDAPSIRTVNAALGGMARRALMVRTSIPSNDFNTMIDIGVFPVTNQIMDNAPQDEQGEITGTLTVTNNGDEANLIIYQKYESAANFIYLRSYISGAWTEWERNVVKKEFEQVEDQLNGFTIWCDTQEAYDAIEVKDDKTLYFIKE